MDLELKHLGQTLAIGGFAVYGVVLAVRTCRKSWLPRFFEAKTEDVGLQHVPVFLALTLGAGIVLQDLAKDIVSERDIFYPSQLSQVFWTDSELRFHSLFKVSTFKKDHISAEPANLLKDLELIGKHHESVAPYYAQLVTRVGSPPKDIIKIDSPQDLKELREAVNGIFYDAKNRVYKEDSYYHELSDIFDLMDFTRSLTLLCLLFTPLYFVLCVLGFIPRSARFLNITPPERVTLLLMAILFLGGIFVSNIAYRLESEGYNRRVFGYYISIVMDSKK